MLIRSTWEMIMGLEEDARMRDKWASSVSVLMEEMNEGSVRQGKGALLLWSMRTRSEESVLLSVLVSESARNAA